MVLFLNKLNLSNSVFFVCLHYFLIVIVMLGFTVDVSAKYISASCNPNPGNFDVNESDLICYGSGCSIVLYNIKNPAKLLKSYVGHKDRVNCVKWLRSTYGSHKYFVSGSCDTKAIVWREKEDEQFNPVVLVEGHQGSITCIDCIEVSSSSLFLVTTSSDCTTKVWNITRDADKHSIEMLDELMLNNKLVLSLAFTLFQNSVPLIACGADDQQIHLFIYDYNQEFRKVISLSGHLQWIKSLSFCQDGADTLMASASQDCYIRIWRISLDDQQQKEDELKLTSDLFTCKDLVYRVALDTILQSHEGWVNSAHWNKLNTSDNLVPLRLVTSSMDKTIIEWEMDEIAGVWLEKIRVGEVGGSQLGFIGAKYSSSGSDILACSFHGAFHLWSKEKGTDLMKPGVTCGGHLGSVLDICWNKTGDFLLSVGSDQTTRIHAQWKDVNNYNEWYEIARPQIHGYDMRCVCSINRFSFASGADEKIIRVFNSTKNFITNFINLCKVKINEREVISFSCDGACVPALGLSNKSVSSTEKVEIESGNYFVPQILQEPPTEENLMQNTLWPEEQKLYGHGYEVFALACNSQGDVIASACKASQKEHAAIILWQVGTWKQIAKLVQHVLTVTQLAFSHNDQYLLSVSRDRTWSVFKSNRDVGYTIFSSCDKKTTLHNRIIWGCSWSHDDKYFITVSRDKKAFVWCLKSSPGNEAIKHEPASEELDAPESITSVDFAPCLVSGRYFVALGMETGIIQLYFWVPSVNKMSWTCLRTFDYCLAHHKTVQRISFRPLGGRLPDAKQLHMASCSDDGSVKIFEIFI